MSTFELLCWKLVEAREVTRLTLCNQLIKLLERASVKVAFAATLTHLSLNILKRHFVFAVPVRFGDKLPGDVATTAVITVIN